MKKPFYALIPVIVLAVLLSGLLYFAPYLPVSRLYLSGGALAVSAIVLVILIASVDGRDRKLHRQMDAVFSENSGAAGKIIRDVTIPCALINSDGYVVWKNALYEKLFSEENIHAILPTYNARDPVAAISFDYAGGSYLIKSMPVSRRTADKPLTFQYWIDRTEAAHYQRLHEEQMPYVALVYVDNYEELTSDIQFHRTTVLAEVERLVAAFSTELEGIYRRYESGRFVVVFEARMLSSLEDARFPLLEQVRKIDTGTGITVTLSIAVGVADRLALSDESARQAMELALGRGGDQAVVKKGVNYRFFGGRMQLDAMQSRVKARLFSKALRQLFENAGDVFIMGHAHADMDCIGAALGVATCAKHIGSRAFIVLDSDNAAIDRAVDQIKSSPAYAGMIVPPEQAEKMMRANSVLVIVDTQRPKTTCAPALIALSERIVLIDHHRRSADYIENATLHYLESRASSASELITEVIQYFDEALRPPSFVCGALLAGITVDTKHFAFNVGSRTFEAAGYLRKNGADMSMVKQLFQDDMESYIDCAETVRAAELVDAGIAVSACGEGTNNAKLIAAKAADELVGIRGIEAAFVLGEEDGFISVSGRSLGRINAQLVCEKLGGGGHLTMAGAQLTGIPMGDALELLRASIVEYLKEADLS